MIDFDNTIAKSFNAEFCAVLEYHLTKAFENNRTNKSERFWCDGIKEPEVWRQNLDSFNETKEIVTTAWLGATGQDEYKMVTKLGEISYERSLKGLGLHQCLPNDQTLDWVRLDKLNRTIVLQLL